MSYLDYNPSIRPDSRAYYDPDRAWDEAKYLEPLSPEKIRDELAAEQIERDRLWHKDTVAPLMVACPSCGADAGSACWLFGQRNDKALYPCQERMEAYRAVGGECVA